ncbi:MAG: ABC transporter substrate-binding protein [Candidatus Rokubacteria bacterium]|nr:ABC transporter substrate-binding protein [Candidatus Rokubacteria bacterium]
MTTVRIVEPFRSLFYVPQFVALHGGHLAAEGLEISLRTAGGGLSTTGALIDGDADICLGGIMRSLDVADRGGPCLPHFAGVNSKNGFFLLSREPRPRFAWADVAGRTVISFAEAPTPWQCMLTVLRSHGVDPATVRIERTLPVAEAVAAFERGHGDFLEQGQPVVEQMIVAGRAHLAASMGEATGPVPFSSYMTTWETLRDRRELVARFARALYRAQRWMHGAAADEIASLIAPSFPDIAPDIRERVIARFKRQDTWARDPLLRREGYDYLHRILRDGGFIKGTHRYEDLIDTEIAREVMG